MIIAHQTAFCHETNFPEMRQDGAEDASCPQDGILRYLVVLDLTARPPY